MSFDIHRFIEQIVKNQLPNLAMKDPYLGAGILAGGIEFMGACLDAHPIEAEGKSAARFCQALNELFTAIYHPFSRFAPYTQAQKPVHDLYASLRCGMAHVLKPQGVLLTGSINEATADGHAHLQILNRGGKDRPLIIVEQFCQDYLDATAQLEAKLAAAPLPAKLQGIVMNVWS